MISIQTSASMMNILSSLNRNSINLNTTMERLSTGYRINRPSDGAAEYSMISRMLSDVSILKVASNNAKGAIAMTNTADGAVQEIQNMVSRIKDLATQAASNTNTSSLSSLDAERAKLESQITNMANGTSYNGVQLIDGTGGSQTFQVGRTSNAYDQVTLDLSKSFKAADLGFGVKTFGVSQTTAGNGSVTSLTTTSATEGAASTAYSYASTNTGAAGDTLTITGADGSTGTATLTAGAAFSVSMSNGAVLTGTAAATLADSTVTGKTTIVADSSGNISTLADAQAYINVAKAALDKVITNRAEFGSTAKVLGYVDSNITETVKQLNISVGAIRDANMAQEVANKARYELLQNASYSLLTSINQSSQNILSLFR